MVKPRILLFNFNIWISDINFDFLREVRVSFKLESDKTQFFEKKKGLVGLKVPRMRSFKFYENSAQEIFLIFCRKLQQDKVLSLPKWFFGGKILFSGFRAKRGQTVLKGRFFRYCQKSMRMEFFYFCFARSSSS